MTAVSFIMPAFNAERYLRQALNSILHQTFTDWELVVIDDGSTDGTWAILEEHARRDTRIRLRSRANTGYQTALNEAIGFANAPLLARMDADDVCLPDRLECQVAFMAAHPECVVLGGQVEKIDPDGVSIYHPQLPRDHETIEATLLTGGHAIWHPSVIMRRDAVLAVGGYRTDLVATEDLALWLRLAEVGQLANLAKVVIQYRVNITNVTFTRREQQVRETRAIIRDARERRGLSVPEEAKGRPSPQARANPAGTRAWWAIQALVYGDRRDAQRLARKALQAAPLASQPWAAMALTHTGAIGQRIAKRRYNKPPPSNVKD